MQSEGFWHEQPSNLYGFHPLAGCLPSLALIDRHETAGSCSSCSGSCNVGVTFVPCGQL